MITEAIRRLVATYFDHPSVYMGGPSKNSMRRADSLIKDLKSAGFSQMDAKEWDEHCRREAEKRFNANNYFNAAPEMFKAIENALQAEAVGEGINLEEMRAALNKARGVSP